MLFPTIAQLPTQQFMTLALLLGTRTCPGRNISQWQLFILLTTLLQRFDVRLDGDVGEDIYGLIRYPGDFKVVFSDRKSQVTESVSVNGSTEH